MIVMLDVAKDTPDVRGVSRFFMVVIE
jgi:hypothetical protein